MPNDVSLFNFYLQYRWKFTDFEDFQDWFYATVENGREGAHGAGALKGLVVSTPSLLNVGVTAGIAYNDAGRVLVLAANGSVTLASPVGNPCRSLVVLRPVDTQADAIPRPTSPYDSVYKHVARTAILVAIDGTAAATPTYPAIQTGDVIVAGFLLTAGMVTVTMAAMETYKRDITRAGQEKRVRAISAAHTVDKDDDIIEANTATVTLPADPTSLPMGKVFTLVNKRTVGNAVTLDGNGNNISGQATQICDDRESVLRFYSNWTGYNLC